MAASAGQEPEPGTAEEQLFRWRTLYRSAFGIRLNTEAIRIPDHPQEFNRLLVVHKSLTLNRIVKVLRKRFKVWVYIDNLNKGVTRVPLAKRPESTYALWVREGQEADENFKNKSANDLERDGVNCLALKERLLYELVFHSETGEHLDVENWTLCAGSRDSDGDIPYVSWDSDCGGLDVSWWEPDDRDDRLRARQAVS